MNNKFFPSNFMFLLIMLLGIFFSLSSSHWLTMWMGMELNLMGFLPLINIKGKLLEAEASMKYFIIQSVGSSLLIMLSIIMYYMNMSWYSMFNNYMLSSLITLSLILKLGGAPMHFWVPSITKQMSWLILFLTLTIQKLAPLLLLSFINNNIFTLMLISMMSIIIGSIMALNQTNTQLIMTYSSISHLGWMLSMITINNMMTMIYFINYMIISMPLMFMLSKSTGNQLFNLSHKNTNNMLILTLILSLGGLPPLLGFMSKLLILISLMKLKLMIYTLIMLIGTLISLYLYMNLSLMLLINSYLLINLKKMKTSSTMMISMNLLSSFIFYPFIIMFINYAMIIFYKS
uniref:NADH-ubiquinone oxidoreductase chain 2 n=1 Tax=Idiosepius hallami TaxID=2043216 RepID=X2CTJ8_9MOLL|nr:NADH dehydrogenase subunit 2 [Idiosepius hallami]